MKSLKVQKFKCLSFIALLIASVTFVACSSEDNAIEEPHSAGLKTYTLTVQASKGDDVAGSRTTRALSLDGKTLNATWAEGERVTVYNVTRSADLGGYLEAQSSGVSTILKGSLTGTIENGDQLKLKFLSPSYASQDGTLAYIAANCDYAEATVTVSAVSGGRITTNDASFVNQQAIVKFTLKKVNGSSINAYEFCVSDGTNEYWASVYGYDGDATNEFYMAIPAISTGDVTLKANAYPYGYIYERSGVTFVAGKYYEIAVKMINYLDWSGSAITLEDGDILTGSGETKVSIADGAMVTLANASIEGSNRSTKQYAGINCLGDATIILSGTNTVTGFYENYPGIHVPSGKTLTIQGTGSLNASSNGYAAGIGGGHEIDCGNITINSGTVTATGGTRSAGIGSGYNASCGDIILSGGTITATCGSYGKASIGKGSSKSTCGDITISGSHSVTLNNLNNSGFPVELSTFMDTGNKIYLAQTEWESGSSLEYIDANMLEDDYYHVEFGCLTAQQFVYRPTTP